MTCMAAIRRNRIMTLFMHFVCSVMARSITVVRRSPVLLHRSFIRSADRVSHAPILPTNSHLVKIVRTGRLGRRIVVRISRVDLWVCDGVLTAGCLQFAAWHIDRMLARIVVGASDRCLRGLVAADFALEVVRDVCVHPSLVSTQTAFGVPLGAQDDMLARVCDVRPLWFRVWRRPERYGWG